MFPRACVCSPHVHYYIGATYGVLRFAITFRFCLRALHLYIPAHLSRSKEATLLSSVCTISSIVIACARAFLLGNAYYVWYGTHPRRAGLIVRVPTRRRASSGLPVAPRPFLTARFGTSRCPPLFISSLISQTSDDMGAAASSMARGGSTVGFLRETNSAGWLKVQKKTRYSTRERA